MRALLPIVAAALAAGAQAQPAVDPTQAPAAHAPVDYTQGAAWLCRPDRPADACGSADLDAERIDAAGARTAQPFHAALAPAIDCFYVYPTVSEEPGDYSDIHAGRREVGAAQSQFARFRAVCRTFAPLYRQVTLAGLRRRMAGQPRDDDMWRPAYDDVRASWRAYLAHDNHGRGVVLIGHSQGTILLQRLLADEIDAKPEQRLLVAAFLAGDPGLSVAAGRQMGGTLKSIPVCQARGQVGCVYPWGSYAADDASDARRFGRPQPGLQAACADPAAPGGGGPAPLHSYLRKPAEAPAADPPWVEVVGGYTGACRADAQGAVLRVSVAPGRYADLRRDLLTAAQRVPGWGLHVLDVNLVQGDMLDDVAAEARTWTAGTR